MDVEDTIGAVGAGGNALDELMVSPYLRRTMVNISGDKDFELFWAGLDKLHAGSFVHPCQEEGGRCARAGSSVSGCCGVSDLGSSGSGL